VSVNGIEPRNSEDGPKAGEIRRAFGRSVLSNILGEFGVQAVRVGGFIILARALEPKDFGILRVLIAISMAATMLNTLGIPEVLIQRENLSAYHESTAWWMSLTASVSSGLLLYCGAPLLAWAMAMPPLISCVRLIALPVLLSGTTAVANARLRRRFQFAALATSEVIAELAFVTTALLLLGLHLNRWSLAGGLAARIATQAIAIWIAEGYLPRHWPSRAAAKDIIGFCTTVCSGRLLVVLAGNADYLMVGRLLGASALGFYSMAWDLLRFVSDRLYAVAGRVTLPAFCRLQHDRETLGAMYEGFIRYISRIVLPLMACAVVAAPKLLGCIYGPKWIPAAAPMRLLSGGLALAGLRMAIGSIYYAKGRPSFDVYVHLLRLGLIIAVVGFLARTGLVGVSLGMGMVEASVSIFGQLLVCALTGISLIGIGVAMLPGMKLAALCALATFLGEFIATICHIQGTASLLVIAIPPTVVFCTMEFASVWTWATVTFYGQVEPAAMS
jgi:O-antigen/teichoic acid export membrane protein